MLPGLQTGFWICRHKIIAQLRFIRDLVRDTVILNSRPLPPRVITAAIKQLYFHLTPTRFL
jgi:hypothetical protein